MTADMAKYRIEIHRVEYYDNAVVVEAENLDEAVKKVEAAWEEDDYLWEKTTDIMTDSDTEFRKCGEASETDDRNLYHIK